MEIFNKVKTVPVEAVTKAKGWRTVIFNGSLVAFGVFAELINYLDIAPLEGILTGGYAWIPIVIGAVNIILRAKTTTPLGKK